MNRLELAAQAPLMPDWYLTVRQLISGLEDINSSLKHNTELKDTLINQTELKESWRFYWADEMIKKNEQQ